MTMNLDFTTTQSPTPSDLFYRIAVMTVAWICILRIVERMSRAFAAVFWSVPIPVEAASIPSKLPHPNPPGSAVPFDIPLIKATDEQIRAFVTFLREEEEGKKESSGGCHRYRYRQRGDEEEKLQEVADLAAQYKGMLYEERTMKWIDDHFRLHLPKLKYPYVGRHWNGWSSMWIETAPHMRKMCLACMTIIFEHSINGLVLPGLYLLTHNSLYYNLALYGEIGYMIYASALIAASYSLGRDVTVEQMHKSVWPLLLLHHICSMILCIGCIIVGEGVPRDLACGVLLALLGLTSSLHYVGTILDFSPLAQSNAPYTRLCNHIFCLASQVLFRGIYWLKILYEVMVHCLETHSMGTVGTVAIISLLFSLFNIDFVKFHISATKGCWMKIQQEKKGKEC